MTPIEILSKVRKETNKIILFSSINGKDSILLTDMCCKIFDHVISVYLYTVKDLQHIQLFKQVQSKKYKNLTFIEKPHFALYGYQKSNFLGFTGKEKLKRKTLSKICQEVKEETGIEWACFGFKRTDGLQRRLMMMELEKLGTPSINEKTKNVYPIEKWKNQHVHKYIERLRLLKPTIYDPKHQSQGVTPNDINFLLWCKRNCPQDLNRVFEDYPGSRAILFEYEQEQT